MKKQLDPIKVQITLWILYFLLKLALLYILDSAFYFVDFFLSHILLAVFFYLNHTYILRVFKSHILGAIFLTIFTFVAYLFIRYLIKIPLINLLYGVNQVLQSKVFLIESGYLFFQFYLVSFGYWTIKTNAAELQNVEKEKSRMLLEKQEKDILTARMELDFLKAQINPHFLYNTLSFLYSKSIRNAPEVAEAIHLLSNIMRYSLSTSNSENYYVRLSHELEHIRNLIKIYQIRFNNNVYVTIDQDRSLDEMEVIPLIFITIIENAFKHGVMHDPNKPISITFKREDNFLHFTCINHVPSNPRKYNESSGIGLKNTLKRLNIYYEEHFEYKNYRSDDRYVVEVYLKI